MSSVAETCSRQEHRARTLRVLGLFCAFFSFYLLSAGGHDYSIDGELYFRLTDSLVARRTLTIDSSPLGDAVRLGPDGQHYSKYAPGQSIAEIPAYLLLRPAVALLNRDEGIVRHTLRVWVPTATNAAVSAITVSLVFLTVMEFGYGIVGALVVALVVGLATIIWPYARQDFSEPLQTLLLLIIFRAVRRMNPEAPLAGYVVIGAALGFLVLTKAFQLLVVPVFLAALIWRARQSPPRALFALIVAFGIPVALAVATYLAYNWMRFGAPLNFGYTEGFTTPLLVGLRGWFLSPGKSVFLYSPTLAVAALAAPAFARRHPLEAFLIIATSIVLVVGYAQFWCWHGDWAWGLRYSAPLIPIWMLPLAHVVAHWRTPGRGVVAISAAAGIGVQVLGVCVDPGNYLRVQLEQDGYPPLSRPRHADIHFEPVFSPLLGHWWLLRSTLESSGPFRKQSVNNRANQDMPWFARSNWRPLHPEYALGIDLWEFRCNDLLRRSEIASVIGLITVWLGGLVSLVIGLRRGERGSGLSGNAGRAALA